MVDREAFEPDALDRFWAFVAERQRIWHRRVVLGEAPPWTDDPVLRERRFTNVYRILDPGTQYVLGAILSRDEPVADRLFNVLWCRLVGRAATHERVGFRRLGEFAVDDFEAALREVDREADHAVFTGAYVVAGYAGWGGEDKIGNVARLLGAVRNRVDGLLESLRSAGNPESAYRAIGDLPGFGTFLAYQVLVDCCYAIPAHGGESLLPFSTDEWAAAGPGARRGIETLTRESTEASDLAAMRWLRRRRDAEFDRLDLAFVRPRTVGGDPIELSLADVQNCCCEFSKHESERVGSGGRRRRFDPGSARSTAALRAVYGGYPISIEPAVYPPTDAN